MPRISSFSFIGSPRRFHSPSTRCWQKAGVAVAVPAVGQVAEGTEFNVYLGSHGLFAAHADQLNADLTDFTKIRVRGRPGRVRTAT